MNVIEHIVEPTKLLLLWQGPEGTSRARHVVGELIKEPNGNVLLKYTADRQVLDAAKEDNFQGHPAFRKFEETYSSGVAEAFLRRIPPRSRGDFNEYLAQQRLPNDKRISDFALLGYTGARLPNDGFSLLHTFDNHSGPFEFVTEVAGVRHEAPKSGIEIANLALGDSVSLVTEPANPIDPSAVQVVVRGRRIGYVVRGLQRLVNEWRQHRQIEATIDRINGRIDRPAIYLFVKVGAQGSALTRSA